LKDAAKLFAYFAAVILGGALLAPVLFWLAQAAAAHGIGVFLLQFDFESFFHRALLICAFVFLWPLLRSLRIHSLNDLQLRRNRRAWRDLGAGWLLAALPLIFAALALIHIGSFGVKNSIPWSGIGTVAAAAVVVPIIEETFFRGLILGILLRAVRPFTAALITSAFFAIIHFLKAPDRTSPSVTWTSGLHSIAHSFSQFSDPMLVLAAFATLFLVGAILADARLRTASLWLPIGLHGGWIFVSGIFGKITRQTTLHLPLLGKNLLVGLIPLGLGLITWALVAFLFPHANRNDN
jgi:membrane protease YdiL (CAAX protease family)